MSCLLFRRFQIRFDGDLGENALLIARWTLFSGDGEDVLFMQRSSFSEPVNGDSYEALVSAESRALCALSREIAEAIQTLESRKARLFSREKGT